MKKGSTMVFGFLLFPLAGVAHAGTLSTAALPFNDTIYCDVVNVSNTSTVNVTIKVRTTSGATALSSSVSLAPHQAASRADAGAYCQFVAGASGSLEAGLVYLNVNGYAISLPAY
jgi:hypothetical protein